MPRFKHFNEILIFMREKERIRNLGIIAHIDHGKTTLTDNLLAGAGLMSQSVVGAARVLDYLEEEQKRKITIKTANISLLYKGHVINLVDTPGHVDFTGKVTRALRAIDGAIVVVDAVEGIMAQTEVVTRQALEERVRPILFINKIDRLITELQLTEEQIEKRLQQIIDSFNDLIQLYGDEAFREKWSVNPDDDNVAFGSALHGWGFTVGVAKQRGVKFTHIITAYKDNQCETLRKNIPVHEAIFEMAIKNTPNPRQAQMYRLEAIWDGRVDSRIGRMMKECRDDATAVLYVTNIQKHDDDTTLVTARMFSGTVEKNDSLHMLEAQAETIVKEVYVQLGAFKEKTEQVTAGNIVSLLLSGTVKATETLVDTAHAAEMVPFEGISYVSEPVVSIAVEPHDPKDLATLLKQLDDLALEDPNLSVKVEKQTGEVLLNGMGELHLEIALKQIASNLPIDSSAPRVAYRESVTKRGVDAMAKSPNRRNSFTIRVEPLPEGERDHKEGREVDGVVIAIDDFRNVLVDVSGKTEPLGEEVFESIIAGFEFASHDGPLCGEPLRHVKASLIDLSLSGNEELHESEEVMRAVGKALFGSFLTAKPVLLEPVYKTVISVPIELAKECQRILTARRGRIRGFEKQRLLALITGFVPIAESFGLSRELRSATSGRAFWQSSLESWERVPDTLASEVVAEIRARKGLPADLPEPNVFLETQP
jgi:elongation factor 2